jgi:hypothetical protein
VASVAPAGAGELSLAPRPVQVNEAQASRLYHAEWLAVYARSGPREGTGYVQSQEAPHYTLSALDAAPAAIKGRLRALVERVKDELRRAGVDPRKVRSHLSVRCTIKYATVKRALPAAPMPALARSGQAAGATSVVRTALKEACALRLTLSPRTAQHMEEKRSYSIALPSLQEISQ